MKTIGRNITITLLMAFALQLGFNGAVSMPVQAATTTQQQKAKEAAKKKKQKEAEKKKKAQQKAREQAAKQKANSATPAKLAKPAKPTREEAYQQKVAEIEEYNAYVARYMSRDITHRVGFWGQIGYSNLLPKDINYNGDAATGFSVKSKGGVGGGGGIGYQLRYQRLIFTTGVEMQVYTSLYELSTVGQGVIARSFGMKPYENEMFYTYNFANSGDKILAGFVQIPLLFGMEFANKSAYFLAGPKVGMGVLGRSATSGNLSTSIMDIQAIDPYVNIPAHTLVSEKHYTATNPLEWNMNLALFGEIGMSLDPWIKNKKISARLGVFAEYGLMNVQSTANIVGRNDQPVDYSKVLEGGHPVNDVTMVGALTTTTSIDAKVNPLLVGVKASVWFNLPRKQLRQKNLPKEPMPGMLAQVVNVEDGKGLAGATVTISSFGKAAVIKTTNAKGVISARIPKADYTLTASKMGYYDDSVSYSLTRDMHDTLRISLRPEPKPIVYTLAGRVFAQETNLPLEAEVSIATLENQHLYTGLTADDGLFVTNLLAGQYMAHIRCQGYMPLDQTVQFNQDTLSFLLVKIKEGVKVKINNLYFATNRTYILPESEGALQDLAQFLLDNEEVRIRIIGHTDNVGSDHANQILSEGRANSLRLELIKRGVDASRIESEGRGESDPIDTNDTEEGRQNNRRVEFMITNTGNADIQQIH